MQRRSRSISLIAALATVLAVFGSAGTSSAEVIQAEGLRINFDASFEPQALPRKEAASVALSIGGKISPLPGQPLPILRGVRISLNRHGQLDTRGLPQCRFGEIQPTTNTEALERCGDSLIGEGRFAAEVLLPGQTPYPSRGKILAFYGTYQGRPGIFAHVYGREPVPTSYTMPFMIRRQGGTFGTVLEASLEPQLGEAGYITLLEMRFGGPRIGHLRAGCPAPEGFTLATFPLAKVALDFETRQLSATMVRTCRVAPR